MKLRPYQERSKEEVYELARKGENSVLVVAPTGSGKTSLAASIIMDAHSRGKKAAFIAHRIELLEQTRERLVDAGVDAAAIGITAGNHVHTNPNAPVQVCSVQTLSRRERIPEAAVVFVDEAHRATSISYMEAIKAYKDAGAFIIGLTATPRRTDGKPLREAFDNMVVVSTPSELVAEGYLAAPRIYGVPRTLHVDLQNIRMRGGDYDQVSAARKVNTKTIIGGIVSHWKTYANNERTIVFACSVEHSRNIAASFVEAGIAAESVDGTTEKVLRSDALQRFREGKTKVLCNAELYIEGIDVPSAKCVVLARPTKSLTYYMQMIGRIMRPWNNVRPIVLDHAGCYNEHRSVLEDREWTLDEYAPLSEANSERVNPIVDAKMCGKCFMWSPRDAERCEGCGAEFTVRTDVGEMEGELQAIEPLDPAKAREIMAALQAEANEKNYKPGWAFREFMRRYGERPPMLPANASLMASEWLKLKQIASVKGYKTGWAYFQFKARFGCEPPRISNV